MENRKVEGLELGQKAIAIGSPDNDFLDGEIIYYAGVFSESDADDFYGYFFKNESGLTQILESHEFKLVEG